MAKAHETHPGKNATETAVRMMAWWPGISQDVLRYVSKCKECQENRPSLGKTVSTWTEAEVWERPHMDWGYVKDQGNILVIVDAGSGLIEAFPAGNRTSQTVKVYLSQIFARFGIPRTLVSDNGPEFVSSDLKHETGYSSRSPNLNVSFGVFLQRVLMTLRNTSKTRGKTPLKLLLGRKIRLPAVTDFDLCERVLFKPTNSSPTVPATFIIRKGMNTSFIQPENSNKTVLVSDNQIARLEPDDIKTESTDSQYESSRDDIDVASPNSTEETSVVEGE